MTTFSKNLGGKAPLATPSYAYASGPLCEFPTKFLHCFVKKLINHSGATFQNIRSKSHVFQNEAKIMCKMRNRKPLNNFFLGPLSKSLPLIPICNLSCHIFKLYQFFDEKN